MPRIRWKGLPPALREHLFERLRERKISAEDSAARALEIVGERWSLLIIRDALFRGFTRFSDFERTLGLAPNVLAKRLDAFVAAGNFERQSLDSDRREYVLTRKGLELKAVVVALTAWGDRWAAS